MPVFDRGEFRDNCGFGLMAHIDGEASHRLVRTAISALDRMDHRGAIGADGKTGDGCGLLLKLPEPFFRRLAGVASCPAVSSAGPQRGDQHPVGKPQLGRGSYSPVEQPTAAGH